VINTIIIFFLFREVRDGRKPQTASRKEIDLPKGESYTSIGVSLFLFFSVISVFALFETVFVLLSGDSFGWKTPENGLFFLGNGVISVFAYVAMTLPFVKKLDDRHGMLIGQVFLVASMLSFVVYNKIIIIEQTLNIFQAMAGGVLVSIGFPIAQTFVFAIYSKILHPKYQGTKMGMLTASGSVARMLGPLWAANAYAYRGGQLVFGATAGFVLLTMLVGLVFYKYLVPHAEYDKEQKMLSKA